MSTDNEMDDRLRDAGHRWRAANPGDTSTVDFAAVTPPPSDQPRRNRWLVIASAAAVVVAVAVGGTWLGTHRSHSGNSTQGAGVPSSLTGVEWKVYLVTLHQGNNDNDLPSYGTTATLRFNSDGTFIGDDGVNSMSGPVQVGTSTLHFGDVAVSAVGTTDSKLGQVASAIDSILQGDVTWSIRPGDKTDQLVIDHPGVGELNLVSSTPAVAWDGLVGTKWTIFEVTKETANSADSIGADGSKASLLIQNDGSFTANDGCTELSGTVQITSTSLTFGDLTTLQPACGGQASKIAPVIDAVLNGQVTWSIGDAGGANDLSIEHAGVGSLIYFGNKPPASTTTDPSKMQGTWTLTQYEQTDSSGGSGGSASGSGGGSGQGLGDILVIDADGTFKVQHRCYANSGKVDIGSGTAAWSDVHLDGSIPCPATPDQQDEQTLNNLVDSVLTGDTTWSIDGDGQLTIKKGGDSLGFAPYASDSTTSQSPTK